MQSSTALALSLASAASATSSSSCEAPPKFILLFYLFIFLVTTFGFVFNYLNNYYHRVNFEVFSSPPDKSLPSAVPILSTRILISRRRSIFRFSSFFKMLKSLLCFRETEVLHKKLKKNRSVGLSSVCDALDNPAPFNFY
jgi:hypothetical protein